MSREWRFFLRDAIRFSERICEYVRGLSRHEFESDSRTLDATLRNLELLGVVKPPVIGPVQMRVPGYW